MLPINHTRPEREIVYWDLVITKMTPKGKAERTVKAYEDLELVKKTWTRRGWTIVSVSEPKKTKAIDL